MKTRFLYQLLIILFVHCCWAHYYSIIAPGLLKSNRKYAVSVTLHDAAEPSTMRIGINGPNLNASQVVQVKPCETKFLEYQIPKLTEGTYKLLAEGLSGLIFKNESELYTTVDTGPYIYVQTDKKIYRPQDRVQFRVVVVNEHTKPLAIREPIRVEILDDADQRVKQFKDVRLIKGVFTGEFQLSEYPKLGFWHIKTSISGRYAHSRSTTFHVRKDVLPKFNLNMECTKFIVPEDKAVEPLKVLIDAKYTYDKYVEGSATIELRVYNYVETLLQQKNIDILTQETVEFDLSNTDFEQYKTNLFIIARFTELHTGNTEQKKCFVSVYQDKYEINIDELYIKFNRTKPYQLKAAVRYRNGSIVMDPVTPVYMQHGLHRYEAYLNDMGEATFEFEHNLTANHIFRYKNSSTIFPNIFTNENLQYDKEEEPLCKLTLLGDRPRFGTNIKVEVSSLKNIDYFVYTLVGHGDIIRTEYIKVPANQKTYILQIKPTIEMVPITFLYVHYIQNGNLTYAELSIALPNELENKVAVAAPKQVQPGAEVTLEIMAEPNSYVCLLAVDLSVYLQNSGYDIYDSTVLGQLKYDRTTTPIPYAVIYPGLLSGLVTLTNAHYRFLIIEKYLPSVLGPVAPQNVRRKFPETWIFKNMEITQAKTLLTLNIPETITTWRVTAFSVHEQKGLGIIKGPTDIITFQQFFISLNLPYSVKRGEIITIAVTVFNYFNESLDTEVTMVNEQQEYDFIGVELDSMVNDKNQTKHIRLPANSGKTVPFLINPKIVGHIMLLVVANNAKASDGIEQKLKVVPEGVVHHQNQATYIILTEGEQQLAANFTADIPADIVPESEYITVSVGGDMLVPTLDNLNNLVRLPTGCGEQNMVNFAPNILVLDYLKASRQFAMQPQLIKQAKHFIEIGYQQQLSFRHENGGFSVFGNNSAISQRFKISEEPSSWLTAYVIRFFIKALNFIIIEDKIIDSGLDYLARVQLENGEFPNTGYLFDPADQNRYGLTAYVLQTFLENQKYSRKYKTVIDKGLQFLLKNLENIEDLYSRAIISNTLQMAKDNKYKQVLQSILPKAQEQEDLKWWSENNQSENKDVEITGYIAQALLEGKDDSMPILKWLIKQRNSKGGFKSTRDTVVGLQAMVKFAQKYNNINKYMKISYKALNDQGIEVADGQFQINHGNSLTLQTQELPKFTRQLSYEANGIGNILLQISYQYHTNDAKKINNFHIESKVKTINENEKIVETCFQSKHFESTNMVIMELNLPSGYRSLAEGSPNLLESELVQRIEAKNEDTKMILYLDNIEPNVEHCLNIQTELTHELKKRKPAAIVMYDYYNITCYDTVFYEID